MKDELYHGSPDQISEITSDGLFGGIFAGSEIGIASSHGDYIYSIESPRHLDDHDLNYEVEGAWEVALEIADQDESIAESIMSADCEHDEVDGWELQRMRGELAVRLGYTSVEMTDEHGSTTLCLPGCTLTQI